MAELFSIKGFILSAIMSFRPFCQTSLCLFLFDLINTHESAQCFRNNNGAVCLLIIFQNSSYCSSHCQSGAIEGMHEFRLALFSRTEPDVSSSCLVSFQSYCRKRSLRIYRNLASTLQYRMSLPRKIPDLPWTSRHHSIRDLQLLQNFFRCSQSGIPARHMKFPALTNLTSSTLLNWCCRIRPLVSRPAEPASLRKQGVYAV